MDQHTIEPIQGRYLVMAYSKLINRPNVDVSSQLMRLIALNHCWHFDAWLLQHGNGSLYLACETRAGGRDILEQLTYSVMVDHTGARLMDCGDMPNGMNLVTIHDRALGALYSSLNAMHWREIVPMIAAIQPRGYKSRSVALHYIRAPSLEACVGGMSGLGKGSSSWKGDRA